MKGFLKRLTVCTLIILIVMPCIIIQLMSWLIRGKGFKCIDKLEDRIWYIIDD